MTERRARISDSRRDELLEQIARENATIRDVQAIIADMDPDTLAYHLRRFSAIVRRASANKAELIRRMEDEKQDAKNGRECGQ